MIFKIFTAKRADADDAQDTGTYADGAFHTTGDLSAPRRANDRSAHERDYGAGRKVTDIPLGFV
jgi:hypothetical protein